MSEASSSPAVVPLWRWVVRMAWPHRAGIAWLSALTAIEIPLAILSPWPMKILVDSVIGTEPVPAWLGGVVGGLSRGQLIGAALATTVALYLLGMSIGLVHTWIGIGAGQRMVYALAGDVFGHLQRLSLRFHARHSVGDSMRRVTADCGCVATIVRDCVLPGVASLITVLVMFAVMVAIHPLLALLSALVVPVLILAVRLYNDAIADRGYHHAEAEAVVYEEAERTLSAMPAVQAFSMEPAADRQLRSAYDTVLATTLASTGVQFKLKIVSGLAIAAGTAGILYVGAKLVLSGEITVGTLMVFIAYLGSMYAPLDSMIGSVSHARDAAGSARRVRELLGAAQDVRERPGAAVFAPGSKIGAEIIFDRVTVGYEAQRPVLTDVTLRIAPGESVGIVGATGSGKTTLVSLVLRLMDPWTGAVQVGGVDARDCTLRSLRDSVAIVPQETILFPASIAENIAYGRPDASRQQVEAAAKTAFAHEFIEKLPGKYDEVIGERGATLSGGQRQRIAIARALLKDAPILVMDEPTSALDVHTEAELVAALDALRVGRTTLIIAHRLSTLRNVDRLVVLENGRIAEQGSHAELLARGGLYAALWRLHSGAGRPAAESPPQAIAASDEEHNHV